MSIIILSSKFVNVARNPADYQQDFVAVFPARKQRGVKDHVYGICQLSSGASQKISNRKKHSKDNHNTGLPWNLLYRTQSLRGCLNRFVG